MNITSIKPSYLQKGDQIGIVSTARKITEKELKFAKNILQDWGLEVVFGQNIFKSDHQFSGTDKERAEDFQQMLDDVNIKAILCARGGYGTVRIIDLLDFSSFKEKPKWIIGYSDVTVLHSHLNTIGYNTIHASMPINFESNSKEALISIKKTIFGEDYPIITESHPLNKKGIAFGQLVGGNLSILYSLLGSSSSLDTRNKILFIEDLDEYLYHLDRMMMSLKRNGKLSHLKGMIIGGMTKMHDNEIPFGKNANEIILDAVKEYQFPICFNFPAGHTKNNLSLTFGRNVILDVSDNTKLSYVENS